MGATSATAATSSPKPDNQNATTNPPSTQQAQSTQNTSAEGQLRVRVRSSTRATSTIPAGAVGGPIDQAKLKSDATIKLGRLREKPSGLEYASPPGWEAGNEKNAKFKPMWIEFGFILLVLGGIYFYCTRMFATDDFGEMVITPNSPILQDRVDAQKLLDAFQAQTAKEALARKGV